MNDDNAAQRLNDAIIKNDIARASSLILSGGVNLDDEPWPLRQAAKLGRLEIMTLLLDAGADIDLGIDLGINNHWTACQDAIHSQQVGALKLLVDRGANLNAHNQSLLMFAARWCQDQSDQIYVVLLDGGVSIDNLNPRVLMSLVRSAVVYKCLFDSIWFVVVQLRSASDCSNLISTHWNCAKS